MKKIYIKPETLVVNVNVKEHLMDMSYHKENADKNTSLPESNNGHGLAREVIQAPDAWDNEW